MALDRTHQQNVADVRARVLEDAVRIVILSQGDTDVDLWAAERKVDLFEKVFGRPVRFTARNTLKPRRTRRHTRAANTDGAPHIKAKRSK